MYITVESLHCVFETNIVYINYIFMKKFFENCLCNIHHSIFPYNFKSCQIPQDQFGEKKMLWTYWVFKPQTLSQLFSMYYFKYDLANGMQIDFVCWSWEFQTFITATLATAGAQLSTFRVVTDTPPLIHQWHTQHHACCSIWCFLFPFPYFVGLIMFLFIPLLPLLLRSSTVLFLYIQGSFPFPHSLIQTHIILLLFQSNLPIISPGGCTASSSMKPQFPPSQNSLIKWEL